MSERAGFVNPDGATPCHRCGNVGHVAPVVLEITTVKSGVEMRRVAACNGCVGKYRETVNVRVYAPKPVDMIYGYK